MCEKTELCRAATQKGNEMTYTVKRLGYIVDLPDQRDLLYTMPEGITPPPSVDLRPQCPPIYDQGQLGSCTSNAIAGAIEFNQIKASKPEFTPSRLFVYFNERKREHTTKSDSGAMLRDGIKTIASQGVCQETLWPYIISKFAKTPPKTCYTAARTDLISQYQRLDNTQIDMLKTCLASGEVFIFGFTVYESFMSQQVATTGVVPMPQPREATVGGHAVVAVGYDDSTSTFWVRNSWGTSFGMQGYMTMPYAYLTNSSLASDFWQIESA